MGGLWLVDDGLELLDGEAEDIVIPTETSEAGAAATAVDIVTIVGDLQDELATMADRAKTRGERGQRDVVVEESNTGDDSKLDPGRRRSDGGRKGRWMDGWDGRMEEWMSG